MIKGNIMKIFMISILFFFTINIFACDELEPPTPPTEQQKEKCLIQAFDTIIDMYLASSYEEKSEFINSLDDYEIEAFFEYLRDNYPDEYEQIP
jgi:hypothetical protein